MPLLNLLFRAHQAFNIATNLRNQPTYGRHCSTQITLLGLFITLIRIALCPTPRIQGSRHRGSRVPEARSPTAARSLYVFPLRSEARPSTTCLQVNRHRCDPCGASQTFTATVGRSASNVLCMEPHSSPSARNPVTRLSLYNCLTLMSDFFCLLSKVPEHALGHYQRREEKGSMVSSSSLLGLARLLRTLECSSYILLCMCS